MCQEPLSPCLYPKIMRNPYFYDYWSWEYWSVNNIFSRFPHEHAIIDPTSYTYTYSYAKNSDFTRSTSSRSHAKTLSWSFDAGTHSPWYSRSWGQKIPLWCCAAPEYHSLGDSWFRLSRRLWCMHHRWSRRSRSREPRQAFCCSYSPTGSCTHTEFPRVRSDEVRGKCLHF